MMISLFNSMPISEGTAGTIQMLFDVAIKSFIILLATGFSLRLLSRAAAATRHLAWTLALTSVLALPFISLLLPGWQLPLLPSLKKAEIVAAQPASVASVLAGEVTAFPEASAPVITETPARTDPALLSQSAQAAAPTVTALSTVSWSQAIFLLWLTGALIVLTPLLMAIIRVWAISREAEIVTDYAWTTVVKRLSAQLGIRDHIPVLRSGQVTTPMTWGIWSPVILLPEEAIEWSAEWRQIVLLHELAHIRRRDCLTQILAQMACALYWFNPLVWLAARRLRVERELACDDCVLETGTRASDYATWLVDIARATGVVQYASPVAVGMACSQLESRVRAILDPAVQRRRLTRRITLAAALLTVCMLIPLATLQPWADAATAQEKQKAGKTEPPIDTPQVNTTQALAVADEAEAAAAVEAGDLAEADSDAADEQESAQELQSEMREKQQELKDHLRELAELQARIAAESGQVSEVNAAQIARLQNEITALAQKAAQEATATIDYSQLIREVANSQIRINAEEWEKASKAGQQAIAELLLRYRSSAQAQSAGQGKNSDDLTAEALIQMKMHGVTPEYIEALRKLGYDNLSTRDLVQLRIHGINEDYIREARTLTGEQLTISELIQLRISGVTPEYVQKMKAAGFNLSVKELAKMHMFGVTPEYVETLRRMGYNGLTGEQIRKLRMHGVDESYIREMREAGISNMTAEQLTKMRMHGVSAPYIKEMREAGFDNLSVDELVKLRMFGVTSDYIKKMRAAGLKNISLNELIKLKIHGVDEILLKNK